MSTFYNLPSQAPLTLTSPLTRETVERLVGTPLELIQLDAGHCLLVGENARDQQQPKNRAASVHWFELHPESGHSSDFILGPAIFCKNTDLLFNPLDHAPLKPVLSGKERKELYANLVPKRVFTPAEALACSIDNPESCEACGS